MNCLHRRSPSSGRSYLHLQSDYNARATETRKGKEWIRYRGDVQISTQKSTKDHSAGRPPDQSAWVKSLFTTVVDDAGARPLNSENVCLLARWVRTGGQRFCPLSNSYHDTDSPDTARAYTTTLALCLPSHGSTPKPHEDVPSIPNALHTTTVRTVLRRREIPDFDRTTRRLAPIRSLNDGLQDEEADLHCDQSVRTCCSSYTVH